MPASSPNSPPVACSKSTFLDLIAPTVAAIDPPLDLLELLAVVALPLPPGFLRIFLAPSVLPWLPVFSSSNPVEDMPVKRKPPDSLIALFFISTSCMTF